MSETTGRVDRINAKTGQGAHGPWTAYSLQIDGNWWNYGFKAPPCKEGDTVTYTMGKDAKGYDTASNVSVTAAAPAAPTAVAGKAPVNTRDVSIQYQSCRKDAIALLPVLLEQGAFVYPAKTKTADKYDLLLAVVDELTARNYLTLQATIDNGGVDDGDFIPAPGE